ncbi:MAG: hypothetical protein U0941_23530 [Planctomycetaceae bacterium]
MNSFGKILVVFTTACSLGFAAFTLSLVSGGPNWKGEAESAELTNDFLITAVAGEKPMYSAKNRKTDQGVGTQSTLLAEVVVGARKQQVADAKEKELELNKEIERIKPLIEEMRALIPPDQAGLVVRAQMLDKILTQLSEQIQTTTQGIEAKAAAIRAIQKTTQDRREEALRLRNQLELMRTDLYVAQAQQKLLEVELVRVEENLKRLERRGEQLQKQVQPYDK